MENSERLALRDENGEYAHIDYTDDGEVLTITETYVDEHHRGQSIAAKLVEQVLAIAKMEKKRITSTCSYGIHYFEKHPDKIYVESGECVEQACKIR